MKRFVGLAIVGMTLVFVRAIPAVALSPGLASVFDQNSGPTLESNFDPPESSNWTGTFFGLAPHSGAQYFESDNGNFNHDFIGLRYVKQLGGAIQNVPYHVSFYIAANSLGGIGMSAVEFSDFSDLAIGGAGGTMNWLNTPTPGVGQGWVKWSGLYTPSAADVGQPFRFRMTVDIDSRHSLAIDGLMTALVPEPASLSFAAIAALILLAGRRRRDREFRVQID